MFIRKKKIKISTEPTYYNREVRRLKRLVRGEHNRVKRQNGSREYLKQLNKQLIRSKREPKGSFMNNIIGAGGPMNDASRNFYDYFRKLTIQIIVEKNEVEVTQYFKIAEILSDWFSDTTRDNHPAIGENKSEESLPKSINEETTKFEINFQEIMKELNKLRKKPKWAGVDNICSVCQ